MDNETTAGTTNFDDFALCYGLGGGTLINIFEKHVPAANNRRDFTYSYSLDLKALYLVGGKAGYIKSGSISIENDGDIVFDVSKSNTDMLLLSAGFVFEF
jgi:hypothetical protein